MVGLLRETGIQTPLGHRIDHLGEVARLEADRLAASIERAVSRETAGGVRDLRVEVQDDEVLLTGHCATYYTKQVAQHIAMRYSRGCDVINAIDVA